MYIYIAHQKASIVAHLRSCAKAPKGTTRGDSILRLCKRASVSSDVPHRSSLPWKLKHRQMYVQLNKFAKEQGHSLSQVQRRTTGTKKLAGGSKKVIFFMAQHACSICAGYWKTEKSVRAAGPCGGRTARAEWLAMPGRQKCWRQAPKERQEALHKAWRLSATERRKLDDAWASAKKSRARSGRLSHGNAIWLPRIFTPIQAQAILTTGFSRGIAVDRAMLGGA